MAMRPNLTGKHSPSKAPHGGKSRHSRFIFGSGRYAFPLCGSEAPVAAYFAPRRPYVKAALKRTPEGKGFAARRPAQGGNCRAMARKGRARTPAPARGRRWGLLACGFRACAFFVCVGARIGQKNIPCAPPSWRLACALCPRRPLRRLKRASGRLLRPGQKGRRRTRMRPPPEKRGKERV